MPRIYTSANDPLDFCSLCWPTEKVAKEDYANVGDGPDGRGNCFGYGEEHPGYEGEGYRCEICEIELEAKDD